ncbi:Hypothetical predicted protein [Podarcis lilfordi]|uniref:Uncharacterized protein n=1 Tax=Podarcis lilfordi TaxID=74358 RepID=A0AA35KZV0_9SAUR|nr:Hypothetical predicted protein [Podarcis lilfordi]
MPATLRKQRQRCRCSRRGPRSLGALISARAGSACRQLSASSGSAAAARGEVPRSLGALISARAGLGMPAALRKQRQRCRCSRRGPRAWAR